MLPTQSLFPDRERPLIERFRLGVLALLFILDNALFG